MKVQVQLSRMRSLKLKLLLKLMLNLLLLEAMLTLLLVMLILLLLEAMLILLLLEVVPILLLLRPQLAGESTQSPGGVLDPCRTGLPTSHRRGRPRHPRSPARSALDSPRKEGEVLWWPSRIEEDLLLRAGCGCSL